MLFSQIFHLLPLSNALKDHASPLHVQRCQGLLLRVLCSAETHVQIICPIRCYLLPPTRPLASALLVALKSLKKTKIDTELASICLAN